MAKQFWFKWSGLMGLMLLVGIACQLTSPTPASWAGTPTAQAEAETRTAYALTQQLTQKPATQIDLTSTPAPTEPIPTAETPSVSDPADALQGPWLVYPAAQAGILNALDTVSGDILEIVLPQPIYTEDLVTGHSPNGATVVVRAGSPLNTDELALYRIDLPATEPQKITPLLTLSLQRRIVNEEGKLAFYALEAVTRTNGLAWSPNGRFLAFNAALNNDSSDLYVFDTLNNRVERLNGLFTHNASPFWSSGGNWLVSQELTRDTLTGEWRAENVTRIRVPGYDDQNSLYLPAARSQSEVFVGWINTRNFISYSLTADGPSSLRQINVDAISEALIYPGGFVQAAFDPASGMLAFIVDQDSAVQEGIVAGVYVLQPDRADYSLYRAGDWERVHFEPGGMFIAAGPQGVLVFSADGDEVFLPGEGDVRLSPNGSWMVAWGTGEGSVQGARLYQPPSDRSLQTLTDIQVDRVFWTPDSKGFYLFGEGLLYYLSFPGLNMTEIGQIALESEPSHFIWVEGE